MTASPGAIHSSRGDASSTDAPPVHKGAISDESFLRGTIFVGLLGVVSAAAALGCAYAITAAGSSSVLWPIFLALFLVGVLVCLLAVRARLLDSREGPRYFPAVVTNRRRTYFGLVRKVEIEWLSEGALLPTHRRTEFQVTNQDFDRLHLGDKLRFLGYGHNGTTVAPERYDSAAQAFVPFTPVGSGGQEWLTLFLLSLNTGVVVLILPLVPLWLVAFVIARVVTTRRKRRAASSSADIAR